MSLDPALCADGCGRPADRERPMSDGHTEWVCSDHGPCGCLLGPIHTRADHLACSRRLRTALRAMRGEPPMTGEPHATQEAK